MAQFDLKKATVYLRDGYTGIGTGAINNSGGYSSGATTATVDGITGAITTGDYVTIAGSVTNGKLVKHRITAHTETSSNTTSITFTPGLGANVIDNAVITVLPRELEIKIGEGNLTWTEKKTREYVKDRGALDTVRDGDDEPLEIKITATWEFITASTGLTPTIGDVLKQEGEASDWVSSSADSCEPYAVDLVVEYDAPCTGIDDEYTYFYDFRYEEFAADAKAGQFNISGKCNITKPTSVRAA